MPAVSLTNAPCVLAPIPLPPALARGRLPRLQPPCMPSDGRHAQRSLGALAPAQPSRSITRQAFPNDAGGYVPNAPRHPCGESR